MSSTPRQRRTSLSPGSGGATSSRQSPTSISGPRRTKQRQVILEELRKVTCHPSADELYNMTRRRLPHISMGTVYRNLELLVQKGTIQSLEIAGTQKRFDGNASNHYHMRCLKCGRVEDAHIKRRIPIQDVIKEVTDFEITGHRLELIGLCAKCKASKCRARVHVSPRGGLK